MSTRIYDVELTDADVAALRTRDDARALSEEAVEALTAHDRAVQLGVAPPPLVLPEADVQKLRAMAAEAADADADYNARFRQLHGVEPTV